MFRVDSQMQVQKIPSQATPKGEGEQCSKPLDEVLLVSSQVERENPNPYNDSEWRETRTSLRRTTE